MKKTRHLRRMFAGFPLLALLVALASSGVRIPHISAQDQDTRDQDTTAKAPESAECLKYHARIERVFKNLPKVYRGMSTAKANQLGTAVESGITACRSYQKSCARGPRAAEVHYYHAKFLHLLSERFRSTVQKDLLGISSGGKFPRQEFRGRMEDYFQTVAHHSRVAFRDLPAKSPLRRRALELLGQAARGARDHEQARDAYETFLKLYPDDENIGAVITALGRTYLSLELYDKGIELVQKAQREEKIYKSPSHPYLGEVLWKLHEAKGDIEGMLGQVQSIRKLYPLLLSTANLEKHLRSDYERYLIFSGFRLGYCHFAMGRFDEAAQAFQDHVDELSEKSRVLSQRGGALPPYGRIYLKRSADCFSFVEQLADGPAPADFNLEGLWATKARVSLKEAHGKVLAVVFRSSTDARSAPFVEKVGEFCSADEDLLMLTVSYLKGISNVAQQLDELREDLRERGYEGAAGFDPDPDGKSLFRAYKANVGSATFLAIDPAGNVAWFQQDPREVDANLARAILLRLKER